MNTELKLYRDSDSDLWGGVGQGALSGAIAGTTIAPGWGTVIGGVAGGAISLFTGLDQKKKADALNKANKLPAYTIPQAEQQNRQIAQAQANQGLASQQYQNAAKEIQRSQVASLYAAQNKRGGLQSIPNINQQSVDAYGRLNAADATARTANIRQLIGVNNQYAGYEDKAYNYNQRDKFLRDYNYGMSLLGAANQNITGGLDKLAGAGAYAAGRALDNKKNKDWSAV